MNLNSISLLNVNNRIKENGKNGFKYKNLKALSCDTVSFGSMKKTEFNDIDLLVINKFKAPIEKFNSNEDLQKWCMEQIDILKQKDLSGPNNETTKQRKNAFKEWSNYVLNENEAYTNSIALLILDGILTRDINNKRKTELPQLDKGVLAQTILEIEEEVKENPSAQINFNKKYKINLQNASLENLETHIDGDQTGWVVIPSKTNDPEHFEENVERLKALSSKTWCTASYNAEPYLEKGDFHIYLDKGKPRLGVRFTYDTIQEIQGVKNNSRIPIAYIDIAREHTKDCKLNSKTQDEFEYAKVVEEKISAFEDKLKEQGATFKTCTPAQVFDALNIQYKIDKDGLYTIECYKQPDPDFTFKDIGIDENKISENIKIIEGSADFRDSQIKSLNNLEQIQGSAYFRNSKIESLDTLQSIGQCADFGNSKITSLKNLKEVGKWADFRCSNIKDLSNLEYIGSDAHFEYAKIKDLSSLKTIRGSANFDHSVVENLSSLKDIERNAQFDHSIVESVSNLETIGGWAIFNDSKVKDLSSLKDIKGNASFNDSIVENLSALENIGCIADFSNSQVKDLSSLKNIGGDANFKNSMISNIESLKKIGGNVDISGSKLKEKDFKNVSIEGTITNESNWKEKILHLFKH